MDSGSFGFDYLSLRKKMYEEEMTSLCIAKDEIKQKIQKTILGINNMEICSEAADDLVAIADKQLAKKKLLLKEKKLYQNNIEKLKNAIKQVEKNIQKHNNDENTGKELKQMKKPILKALKKYSKNFDMDVQITKQQELENVFIASVQFSLKENTKVVEFVIDREKNHILDFNASSILSPAQQEEIKSELTDEYGLKIDALLSRLRDMVLNSN